MDKKIRDWTGDKNPNWKGEMAKYPNDGETRRNRLKKLKDTNGKCEICEKSAYCMVYLEDPKINHEINNLSILCRRCYELFRSGGKHLGFGRTSKYIRLYGMTLREMQEKYGIFTHECLALHKKSLLKDKIEEWEKAISQKKPVLEI